MLIVVIYIIPEGRAAGSSPRGDGYIRFRCKVKSTGKEEYGGDLKISATSFDGKDLQSDWAGIFVRNARIQIIH